MADILKVFKNVNVTQSASFAALSIPIHTTGTNETIVLKDIQLEITDLTDADAGFYKYTTTLKVDGVAQAPSVNLAGTNVGSTPLLMSGSQIVGPSSAVTLEVIAESGQTNYGKAQCMWVERNASTPTIGNFNMGVNSPADTGAESLHDKVIATGIDASGAPTTTGYSGGVVTSGTPAVTKYYYTDGSDLHILKDDGTLLKTYNWIDDDGTHRTTYGCAHDDTYIYGKTSSASYDYLFRFNHTTMTRATNLDTSGEHEAYGSSNKGWVDVCDGYFYYRSVGASSTTKQVNLTTGEVSNMPHPGSLTQTEFVGGCFNTNVHGKKFLVIHGDGNMQVVDQNDGTTNAQAHGFSSEPTTTNANHVVSIAPGLVWINNGSYNENKIVDLNAMTAIGVQYTQYHRESTIEIAETSKVLIGGKHQTVIVEKPRVMNYRLLASGIQST